MNQLPLVASPSKKKRDALTPLFEILIGLSASHESGSSRRRRSCLS